MISSILKTFKVNHYIKNIVVFVPLIFSMKFINLTSIMSASLMFIAFCFISSAVYVLNDLIDIEQDKKHPIKKNRPIASGKISVKIAILLLVALFVLSSFISFFINSNCFLMVLIYFVLNIFYSLYLKHIALIDASCIAIGFILRILGGCFAIQVLPSPLVILMTFFISNFFTCSKRCLELQVSAVNCRQSLEGFSVELMSYFILINAVLSISFYITYMLSDLTIQRAGSQYLYLTAIPFTLIVYRLLLLMSSKKIEDDPIIYLEQDTTIKWLTFSYIIVLLIVLTILK